MGCFLSIIFIGVACFIASPIVLFFILKNNERFAKWVSELIGE
jgi:predicted PurR-regulated permease PerM